MKKNHNTLTGDPNLVNSGFQSPPENPLYLLQQWLVMADTLQIAEPRALVLSTVSAEGKPSSRVVLLKAVDEAGVVFASSEISQKGRDLAAYPHAAGTLWWRETMQQVNFYGTTSTLPSSVADKMFRERTRQAQAVTALSDQSAPMTDEDGLRGAITKLVNQANDIMRPATWLAYHITIETIEFWHGSHDRFHRRIRYEVQNDGVWQYETLQP